jgi:hypothetical protein
MYSLMSGAIMMGSWVIGLHFLRFWKKTRERLFLIFALAFFILGVERVVLAIYSAPDEGNATTYLIRLLSFLLIIAGIVDKNRVRSGP